MPMTSKQLAVTSNEIPASAPPRILMESSRSEAGFAGTLTPIPSPTRTHTRPGEGRRRPKA
jgi:hypothetical protein